MNTGYFYRRFDYRTNLDFTVTDNLTMRLDFSSRFMNINEPSSLLVVKTRRGEEGKPVIHVRAEAGGQIPVRKPNFLDSYNTALLVNEARTNDGLTKMFTQHDLELFKDGSDPYGYPNVNWYDEVFKKSAMQSNINVDVSGGTKRLKYFVSGGVFLTRWFGS